MQEDELQTREVRETTTQQGDTNVSRQTVAQTTQVSGVTVVQRIVWFIAGFIMIILALRVLLLMLGANQGSAFVDFIYTLGGFFAAPFVGIFGTPVYGEFFFDTASVVAIVVYALIAWGITKLVTLTRPRT